MAERKDIAPEVQARILGESRRRCAICYGLNRDTARKKGQLAHVNRKRDDSRQDNIVFLCLEHHDEYDSRTSQSKGFTEDEVRGYRRELLSELERQWAAGELDRAPLPANISITINTSNVGGAGGPGGMFGGGGGGGGAPMGGGGAGGQAYQGSGDRGSGES